MIPKANPNSSKEGVLSTEENISKTLERNFRGNTPPLRGGDSKE